MRSGISLFFSYLFFCRVPLFFALVLFALPFLSGRVSTIGGLMISRGWTGLLAASTFVGMSATLVVFFCRLIATLAPERFGVDPLPLPARVRLSRVLPDAVTFLLSLPLWIVLTRNTHDHPIWVALGLLLGVALAGSIRFGIAHLRKLLVTLGHKRQLTVDKMGLFGRLVRFLGPGYHDQKTGYPQPSLAGPVSIFLVLAALYAAGFFWLDPEKVDLAAAPFPVLFYVLVLFMLLLSFLAGATFFFDHFRVPLLLTLLILFAASYSIFRVDHHFEVIEETALRPADPRAVVQKRLAAQEEALDSGRKPIVTVISASGGGILSAAWTTQVLTGLQERIPTQDFSRSIHLISSASGGSVGAFFFVEAYGDNGLLPAGKLAAVRQAAMRSSLEATAWGLTFPDALRPLLPLLNPHVNRGWALDQALQWSARKYLYGDASREPTRMSAWIEGALSGRLPGVVLNSTIVDNGQRMLFTNLDFPVRGPGDRAASGEEAAKTLESLLRTPGHLDVSVVTAARLSATFPYVTPVARASLGEMRNENLLGYHLADGGYFDNFGTVAAVEWIRDILSQENLRERIGKVLVLELRAFPPSKESEPAENRGWAFAVGGPIMAVLNVRNSTQTVRGRLELDLLKAVYPQVETVTLRQPTMRRQDGSELEPPLSWYLSEEDQKAIGESWNGVVAQSPEVDYIRCLFREASPQACPRSF